MEEACAMLLAPLLVSRALALSPSRDPPVSYIIP